MNRQLLGDSKDTQVYLDIVDIAREGIVAQLTILPGISYYYIRINMVCFVQ